MTDKPRQWKHLTAQEKIDWLERKLPKRNGDIISLLSPSDQLRLLTEEQISSGNYDERLME